MFEQMMKHVDDATQWCEEQGTAAGQAVRSVVEHPATEMLGGAAVYIGGAVVLAKATSTLGVVAGASGILAGSYLFGRGFYRSLTGEAASVPPADLKVVVTE